MAIELALFAAAVLTLVLVLFMIVVTYNNVIALQRRCERAWANIDVDTLDISSWSGLTHAHLLRIDGEIGGEGAVF